MILSLAIKSCGLKVSYSPLILSGYNSIKTTELRYKSAIVVLKARENIFSSGWN